jgi:ADP-ribose pyrophosphatase YjhB (NUDIX family)
VNELQLLDAVRGIAEQGLAFAVDRYERERYERLLELVAGAYAARIGLTPLEVTDRFTRDVGYPTAKVGVDAAIFGDDQTLLLIRRADSHNWSLPGGWVDPGDTLAEALAREVREETALTVSIGHLIAANSQLPRWDGSPHTSVHLLYCCELQSGTPKTSPEALEVEWRNPREIEDWHQDHHSWAVQALEWRLLHPKNEFDRRTSCI